MVSIPRPRKTSCGSRCGGSTSRRAPSSPATTACAGRIEQLQGWEAAAAAWEPELLSRRMRGYDPGALDRLCHDGEVVWLRLVPRPRDADAPAGAPSKATPISVVFRDDLPWLLEAARAGADPAEPTLGATAEVAEVLRARGACFAAELGEATNRLPEDIERALWDGVSRGLLTSDGFGAIRSRVGRSARGGVEAARLSRLMRGARRGSCRGPLVAGAEHGRRRRPRRARRGGRRDVAQPVGRRVP